MLVEIDSEEFREEVLIATSPSIVLFWASWCPFSNSFKQIFDRFARESDLRFVSVDIADEETSLWEEYDLEIVPTIILFQEGKPTVRRDGVPGVGLSERDLLQFVEDQGK